MSVLCCVVSQEDDEQSVALLGVTQIGNGKRRRRWRGADWLRADSRDLGLAELQKDTTRRQSYCEVGEGPCFYLNFYFERAHV